MNFAPVMSGIRAIVGDMSSYLAIDVETSGLSTARDYILQIGHCAVKDGKVVDRQGFYLDWTKSNVDKAILDWLRARVYVTEVNMAGRGSKKPISWDLLRSEGVDPVEVLSLYRDWFREISPRPLVMHNGWGYDTKILTGHFLQFLPEPDFWFGDNAVVDTGAILKGAQIKEYPAAGQTLQSYSVHACRPGVKGLCWSLHDFAVPHFNLATRYGFDPKAGHDAVHDAWVTSLLFQDMLAQLEGSACAS